MSSDLSGKVAIITGASSGIGFGTAVHFAKLGVKLVITGRNEARLNDAKKECIMAGAIEANVACVVGEITDANVRKALVQTALDKFGALHILVNNAGIAVVSAVCAPGSMDVFDQTFNVNLRSIVELCRLAAEHLIKTKGNIVNISTIGSLKPVPNLGYYSMSKIALDMFTQVLAQELAPKGVRVNSINPGGVDTPIIAGLVEGMGISREQISNLMTQSHPIGRVGTPQDIANAIEFLASDKADWITGTIFKVDGGAMIRAEQIVPNQ